MRCIDGINLFFFFFFVFLDIYIIYNVYKFSIILAYCNKKLYCFLRMKTFKIFENQLFKKYKKKVFNFEISIQMYNFKK